MISYSYGACIIYNIISYCFAMLVSATFIHDIIIFNLLFAVDFLMFLRDSLSLSPCMLGKCGILMSLMTVLSSNICVLCPEKWSIHLILTRISRENRSTPSLTIFLWFLYISISSSRHEHQSKNQACLSYHILLLNLVWFSLFPIL